LTHPDNPKILDPAVYETYTAVLVLVPLISIFNAIQDAVSIFGGFLLYEAVIRRLVSLKVEQLILKSVAIPYDVPCLSNCTRLLISVRSAVKRISTSLFDRVSPPTFGVSVKFPMV